MSDRRIRRILAIETSTSTASVALLEAGKLVLARRPSSDRPNQSAELLLPLIAQVLAEAGWPASSLDRLGVSVGPGSFTGLRVGIACAQGLALGLGVPLVGVTSLRAMARAVPREVPGLRVALLDARRNEVFAAAYTDGPDTGERLAPVALPITSACSSLERDLAAPLVWIGSGLGLVGRVPSVTSPETEAPSAFAVGLLADELNPDNHPPLPVYVRDAGAVLPNLGAPAATE